MEKKIAKAKPPGWPLNEKEKRWSGREIKSVAEALSAIPDNLKGKGDWKIYRMAVSVNSPNPGTNADTNPPEISLYDTAFGKTFELSRVIAHELAHIYYTHMTAEEIKAYQVAMNWFPGLKDSWISRKDGFLKETAKISPEEDFAVNVEYILFEPDKLKKESINAFNWIRTYVKDLQLQKGCKYEK